jgi:hypothetical protein
VTAAVSVEDHDEDDPVDRLLALREEQGLPARVADPAVLATVADVLIGDEP